MQQRHIRLGALCLIGTFLFFPAQFLAQWASPEYDILRYDISILGISSCQVHEGATSGQTDPVCSPLYLLFNVGIIVHGFLSIMGIWLTRGIWPKGNATSFALVLLSFGGIGAMMVGAFPLDGDMTLHVVGAVLAIALPGFGFVILARTLRTDFPELMWWTGFVGVLVLLSGLGHALGGQPFGRGAMERLAVWPQTLWYVGIGVFLYSARTVERRRKTGSP